MNLDRFINITPIGEILSPYTELSGMPIQPKGASETVGQVILKADYSEGLTDLDGFSHIYLIYLFHRVKNARLTVVPFMDTVERGVFSTRSPLRPNHIGISIVELLTVRDNTLEIKGVDILNKTPLIDIKPYIHNFDSVSHSKSGWMTKSEVEVNDARSDNRFT